MNEQTPLPQGVAWRAVARCVATTAVLLARRRVHLPRGNVGMRLRFADGTASVVYRETVVDGPGPADPCVLVVRVPAARRPRPGARAVPRGEPAQHPAVRRVPRPGVQALAGRRRARRLPGALRVGRRRTAPSPTPGRCGGCSHWSACRGSIHYRVRPGASPGRAAGAADLRSRPPARRPSWWRPVAVGMSPPADVLVVGAGPTGLALALQAHEHGARVRVVERRPEAFRPSRAMIVHPRTLELLRPLGVTDELLALGDASPARVPAPGARRGAGRRSATFAARDRVPAPGLPAPDGRRDRARRRAGRPRGARSSGASSWSGWTRPTGRRATLRTPARAWRPRPGGWWSAATAWTARCGARAGIGWPGGTYRAEAVLADVDLDGDLAAGVAHVAAGRRGLLFLFALGEGAPWRLLATRPAGRRRGPAGPARRSRTPSCSGCSTTPGSAPGSPRVALVGAGPAAAPARRPLPARAGCSWPATPRTPHSPAGGQGMNTGIQDAAQPGLEAGPAPGQLRPRRRCSTPTRPSGAGRAPGARADPRCCSGRRRPPARCRPSCAAPWPPGWPRSSRGCSGGAGSSQTPCARSPSSRVGYRGSPLSVEGHTGPARAAARR